MKFERAIVHIGVPKTGTTSIQSALFANRVLLGEHGVCYPRFRANHGNWLYPMFSEAPHKYAPNLRAGITTLAGAREANARRSRDLDCELATATAKRLILSAEDLSFLTPDGVRAFKRWLDRFTESVSVVLFLREPVAWATSRTQEALRQRRTLEQAYKGGFSFKGLRDRLAPWLDTFGREAVAALDFDAATRHPLGIVGAFCELAGLPTSFVEQIDTSRHLNQSLSALGARLLSALNRSRPFFIEGGVSPLRSLDDHLPFEKIRGERFRLPRAIVERVVEQSRAECEWVADALGIAYTPTVGEAIPDDDADASVVSGEGLESLALLVADLHRSLRAAQEARAALEARLAALTTRNDELTRESSTRS